MGSAAFTKLRIDTARKTPAESEQESAKQNIWRKWSLQKIHGICLPLKT